MSTTITDDDRRLARLRRRAVQQGEQVRRIRPGTADYGQYGPFVVVDLNHNWIIGHGLDLDQLEEWYGAS